MQSLLRCNLALLLLVSLLVLNGSNASKSQPPASSADFDELDQSSELDRSDEAPLTEEDFAYITPDVEREKYYLFEHFDDQQQYTERWIKSLASKADSKEAKYDGEWSYIESHPKLKGMFLQTCRGPLLELLALLFSANSFISLSILQKVTMRS